MADINDKLGRPSASDSYALATTVKTARTAGEVVLACHDLSRFDDTLPVYFVTYKKGIDPETNEVVITNQTSWKALVNPDNNTLTNLKLAPGYTDEGNAAGDYVECIPTSFWGNSLVDALLVNINPDGTTKDNRIVTYADEMFADNIVSGTGVVVIVSGLTISISNMTYYINGVRYTKSSIPNKVLTATKDTYGFIDTAGNITWTEVTVGATEPTTPANSVAFVVITTNASTSTKILLLNRAAVASENLNIRSYTDANGWTVRDFGTFKRWSKHTTQSINTLGAGGGIYQAITLPVGLTYTQIRGAAAKYELSFNAVAAADDSEIIHAAANVRANSNNSMMTMTFKNTHTSTQAFGTIDWQTVIEG